MSRRACLVAALLASLARPARAYEFSLRARTVGQAYQLRNYRLVGPDLFQGRRRVTQLLSLRLYDIGDLAASRRRKRLFDRGPRVTWQSYLRIDHDFGDYATGRTTLPGPVRRDVLDLYPELAESVVGLDLMYGFLEVDGVADDRVSLQVGRMIADDGWGNLGVDGARLRVTPAPALVVSASAGLRVRARSPLGVAGFELDGTSGAGCREYVEGPTPGSGSWQLVDRNRAIRNRRLASDYEYCPQREVRQPTVAASVAIAPGARWTAELGYRRTWSDTVGLIGPVDRLDYPDRGLYPNERGQAPASGVNEERLYARASGVLTEGPTRVEPFVEARWSVLHGLLDRADAGVRVRHGAHVLEPVVEHFFPTFDGDSIYGVFSLEPTRDLRVSYQYAPAGGLRGHATAWLRDYVHDGVAPSRAGGMDAGIEHAVGGGWRARLDGLWDDGWGGRRVGGAADAAWRPPVAGGRSKLWARGRIVVLGVREDAATQGRRYATTSLVASTTYRIAERVAVHAIGEVDYDALQALQTRLVGVLDLSFAPEP